MQKFVLIVMLWLSVGLTGCAGTSSTFTPPIGTGASPTPLETSTPLDTPTPFPTPPPLVTPTSLRTETSSTPTLTRPAATPSPLSTPTTENQTGDKTVTPASLLERFIQEAIADLARRLGIAPTAITVTRAEAVEWSDTSLGCPQPGMMYAQVITPGYLIVLEANGQTYEYHASRSRIFLCE